MAGLNDPAVQARALGAAPPGVAQASAADATASGRVAPPFVGGDVSRRSGDLPYWRRDERWLRSYLPIITARAKQLCRNNRHARTAARDLPTAVVGSGFRPMLDGEAAAAWKRWATRRRRIHASARLSWIGLQWLAVRSVMVTGEAFAVFIRQPMAIGAPTRDVPFKLELFDADGLSDTPAPGMARRSTFDQGREMGPGGRVTAWHFRIATGLEVDRYVRVPASDVVHIFDQDDCASVRGTSWFAPIVIDLAELAGYQDSTAAKQHLASKIAVMSSDMVDLPPGQRDDDAHIEDLEPGAEIHVPPGRKVEAFQAPLVREYGEFVRVNRSEIAVCLGVRPEVLSGDYSGMSWTVARAAYLDAWARDEGHRQRWLRPSCEEVYDRVSWSMGGAAAGWPDVDDVEWAGPVMRAIDPDREGIANQRLVRNGFRSWSDIVRDSGRDPVRMLDEIASERQMFRDRDVVVDSDPGRVTMQGQAQQVPVESEPRLPLEDE